MTTTTLKYLLQSVKLLTEKYDEIERITGERFNIFKTLNVSTLEVKMHSALLGELLNTQGTHGCGDVFLKCFLSQQKEKNLGNHFSKKLERFLPENSKAMVEYNIGYKNIDATTGGRIDILLESATGPIIIENKIYARDQENQLIRYNNYNADAPIFYLTLDGCDPSIASKGVLEKDSQFVCISYKEDIVQWLEACIKETASVPMVRETIKQYLNLVKFLTHQTINKRMSSDIKQLILKDNDAFESARAIASEFPKVIEEIKSTIGSEIEYSEHILNWEGYKIDFYITYDQVWIFGFCAVKDNSGGLNKSQELLPLVNILKQIDSKYKLADYYLGWKNCYNPSSNTDFAYIENLNLFDLYDKEIRAEFISKVHQKAKQEIQLFLKKVTELESNTTVLQN